MKHSATRVGFALSAGVTLIFFALILAMAFRPRLLTGFRGLIYSLGFVLLTLAIMAGYSWWQIRRIDE